MKSTEQNPDKQSHKNGFEEYKSIIDNLSDIYYRADIDGKLIKVSPSCLEVFGYSSMEEVIGRSLEIVYQNPNERSEFVNLLKKSGKVKNYRTNLLKKDGSDIYIETTANILLDEDGNYIGVEGIVRDITDRKRAEEALIKSEERFRSIFENAPLGLLLFDEKGKIIICNDMFVGIIGSSHEKLKGLDMTTLPDKRIVSAIKSALSGTLGKYEGYYHSSTADKVTPVRVLFTPIIDCDRICRGGVGIVEDITERKQVDKSLLESQKENQAIINASPDLLFRINRDGLILSYHSPNESALYIPPKELIGKNIKDILPPHISKHGMDAIERSFQSQETITFEYELTIKGEQRYFEDRIIALTKDESLSFIRDITERKRAEEALNKSEEKYRHLVNNTNDVIWTQNLNFQTTYMSSSVERTLGYTVDEYLALPVNERLPAESMKIVLNAFNQNIQKIKNGEVDIATHTFSFEMLHKHKNGELLWGEVNCSFLHDDKKNITGIHGITRDITNRKQTENALRESEDRYRRLVEQSPFSIAIYQEGKFVYMNPAGLGIFGATNELELIDKSILTIIHPNFKSEIIKQIDLVEKGSSIPSQEVKLLRLDGIAFDAEMVVIATTYKNKPAGQVIVKNITERKRAEEALRVSEEKHRVLLELAPDAFFQGDSKGNFITVNEKAEELTGYSREELLTLNMIDLFTPIATQEAPLRYDLLKNGEIIKKERNCLRKNGEIIQVEMHYKAMFDNTYQCFMRDITDRKKAEQNLLKLNDKLKELNSTKDKLFSIIAHDLRSPFNGILGFSDLLRNKMRDIKIEDAERWVTQINFTAKHTLNLLDNLLEWAKTQTGQIDCKPEDLILLPIMQDIVNVLDSSAKIKNISLRIIQPEELSVFADLNMLNTILRNLISNAIKFTDLGGIVDIIAIRYQNQVEIIIKDSGVGMNEETKNNLFKTNTSHTMMGTANEKGSGLGLIICKEFIEKQGGNIKIESELGKGSQFIFTLPQSKQGNL